MMSFGLGENDNRNMFLSMRTNFNNFIMNNNMMNMNNNNMMNMNNNNMMNMNNNNMMSMNNNNMMSMNNNMMNMNNNMMSMNNNNMMSMNNNMMNMNNNMMNMNNNMMNMNNNMMNMNNNMMYMNNQMNPFMNFNPFFMMNNNINFSESDSLEPKKIERKEGLDIKCDVDRLLQSNRELENKNKDLQTIINYIPFTIIQDEPKNLKDEPACVICLSDFEIGQKVSALPCCHTFHTKCIDDWIKRKQKCPVCKFEITLKNILGEDFIREQLKKIKEREELKRQKEKEEELKRQKEREEELKRKKEEELKRKKEKEEELKRKKEEELKRKKEKEEELKRKK